MTAFCVGTGTDHRERHSQAVKYIDRLTNEDWRNYGYELLRAMSWGMHEPDRPVGVPMFVMDRIVGIWTGRYPG